MTRPLPQVTVVLPVYNGEAFIETALASILAQKANFELIVSDDNSSDRTVEIIEGCSDERIRLLKNQKKLGYIWKYEPVHQRVKRRLHPVLLTG